MRGRSTFAAPAAALDGRAGAPVEVPAGGLPALDRHSTPQRMQRLAHHFPGDPSAGHL